VSYSNGRRFHSVTYTRDADGNDEAMNRRYSAVSSRFSQPDPYDGSYDFMNPQSFNRYSYVNNDPVNFVDPSGLMMDAGGGTCYVDGVPMGNCGMAFALVNMEAGYPQGGGGFYLNGSVLSSIV
jgi:RHS repeat-associated protein